MIHQKVFCAIIKTIFLYNWVLAKEQTSFRISSLLKDPRQNSSFYDFIVNQRSAESDGPIFVGNATKILHKGFLSLLIRLIILKQKLAKSSRRFTILSIIDTKL